MNWLLPPFNNAKVRRAAAMALNQIDFLQANIGDSRFYRTCKAMFTCETPLASDAGMEGLVEGNSVKAKQMLGESGYDGTPVTLLYPTDLGVIKQLGPVAKSALEKAGFKVDLQPMDWQSMIVRLAKKGPVAEGGWNAFFHELVTGRHPRSADDALLGRELRSGPCRVALRPGDGKATRQVREGHDRRREEGDCRGGPALRPSRS